MSVNKVILVGNVGKDPEVRYLEGGAAVCKFSLATSEAYKNREGEKVTTTEWHNVVLWRGLAEIAEKYVKKGMQLYIEGKIKTRSYTDQEGHTKYITEIVADSMQMLTRKSDDSQHASSSQTDKKQEESKPDGSPSRSDSPVGSPDSENGFISEAQGADDLPF